MALKHQIKYRQTEIHMILDRLNHMGHWADKLPARTPAQIELRDDLVDAINQMNLLRIYDDLRKLKIRFPDNN